MKIKTLKGTLSVIIVSMLIAIFGITMIGCGTDEDYNPYISVSGLSTVYSIGDTLDTDAKVRYYNDTDATEYTEVGLIENMVTGFSTEAIGTYEMVIEYNDCIYRLEYTVGNKVLNASEASVIMGNAKTSMQNADKVYANCYDLEGLQGQIGIYTKTMAYTYSYYMEGIYEVSSEEQWELVENYDWVRYYIETEEGEIKRSSRLVDTETPLSYDPRSEMYEFLDLSNYTFVEGEKTGATEYVLTYIDEYGDEFVFAIENNYFTNIVINGSYENDLGEEELYSAIYELKYNEEATTEIPAIPTDITWSNI